MDTSIKGKKRRYIPPGAKQDVYKRQPISPSSKSMHAFSIASYTCFFFTALTCILFKSVSYTHLDVYKRQDEYNKNLLNLGDLDIQRLHYKKDEIIANLFEEEKKFMFNLPSKEFEVGRIKNAITNKYGKAEFETNIYSTSPAYSGKEVILKITADKVIVMNKEYTVIVTHDRIYDKNKESMKWYPYLEIMAKRPNAIKYTGFFNELPDIWKNYIDSQNTEGKKKTIKALMKMIEGDDELSLIHI